MSTYDLEEQEQLAALKGWWQQYGRLVVMTVGLAAAVIVGFAGWRHYQASQAAGASAAYEQLATAARSNDARKTRELAALLVEKYPRTVYTALGALVAAKVHFEAGDTKAARAQLAWVVENARDPELATIARVRLAAVLIDEKAYDEALKVLEAKAAPAFEGLLAAARGDVYLAKGQKAEARAAYKSALDKLARTDRASREVIELKLEALGAG